ncbi:MAG: NAD+ synthase [Chlamydiae bacterium CG10_big_fil_rev_8_21_14_0_10_35_9]|nr:MAG: NAD+ synthase [Chlamydiae bacterium CG10_big_fil_rev_8_21_14_0_10_35_9]
MRIFVAQLNPIVGNLQSNTGKIIETIYQAKKKKADIVLFPEMAICGYPPEDLVLYSTFIDEMQAKLQEIAKASDNIMVVVGLVRKNPTGMGKLLYNSAAVIIDTKIVGFKDKTLLPTYDVFNESRYFEEGEEQKVFHYKDKNIGVMICEDTWQHAKGVEQVHYKRDPIQEIAPLKPDVLVSISASPYYFMKKDNRLKIFAPCASFLKCPFIWCNQVGGNDSLIFDGHSLYINENEELIQLAKGFEEDTLIIDLEKKEKAVSFPDHPLEDLYQALVLGVKDYFAKQGFSTAVIGLSGGVDSALVACIAKDALGSENLLGVSMPSRFTSLASMEDARALAENLNISLKEVPIDHLFQQYLDLLSPLFHGYPPDATEENLQARIRGMVLMAISNKLGYLVLSTGNKSEMAIGYSTLYGDLCGGLGIINDVSKTKVYELCRLLNKSEEVIPQNIIEREPSAELKANQKDQDTLPDYAILDAILEGYVEGHMSSQVIANKYDLKEKFVEEMIHKIHLAEYKRRQSPPGLRVTKKAFSKGRVFPIVQKWA